MKIVVLGAGVIGVTTAWYLAKSGHEVTVVDRRPDVAMETSFANAGQISPGYSAPWAAPGIPLKAMKWLTQDLAPFKLSYKDLDMHSLIWMMKMLANCNKHDYYINKSRMMRVAQYSLQCFQSIRNELNIEYDQRMLGTLQVFRTQKQIDASKKDIAVLQESHVEHQVLSAQECLQFEPALKENIHKIVGGLRLPNDEIGNCQKFTTQLAEHCKKLGVIFLMDTNIISLNKNSNVIQSVITDKGEILADSFVLALGSYSTHLLRGIDIKIPVYPIKGYSLSMPILNENYAPMSTVMDETYKVAMTRLGNTIRVGGMAEIASYNLQIPPARKKNISHSILDLFPKAGDYSKAEFWTGLRPMTPDGTPILGKTEIENLYLNTGHGTLGWTMSLGCAKYVSDMINNHPLEIDDEGLSINRYQ
ncbi:D-amino acid dehydrogenase [Marinicellulosiphila megalodicopiae]|uniref:D-amino acid dehydrogenase n=1 Tax=Marinicellulosiphila megalodicopiae TaxID=2724896 RepID=UPI003BB200D2